MEGGKRFTVNCSMSIAALKLKYETDNFEGFFDNSKKTNISMAPNHYFRQKGQEQLINFA